MGSKACEQMVRDLFASYPGLRVRFGFFPEHVDKPGQQTFREFTIE